MELERPFEAIAAFERAAQSSSSRIRQDANYGRSLAFLRKGLPAQADASIRASNNAPERFVEISSATLAENAIAAYRARNYAQAAALLEQRQSVAPMTTDLLVLLGWSYEKTGRLSAARQLWQAAAQAGSSEAAQALLTTE